MLRMTMVGRPATTADSALGPWDFTGTYNTPVQQTMDIFSHPNDLGRAWTLFNADAPPGPGTGTDIAQAGRALTGGLLLPGQTIHGRHR